MNTSFLILFSNRPLGSHHPILHLNHDSTWSLLLLNIDNIEKVKIGILNGFLNFVFGIFKCKLNGEINVSSLLRSLDDYCTAPLIMAEILTLERPFNKHAESELNEHAESELLFLISIWLFDYTETFKIYDHFVESIWSNN